MTVAERLQEVEAVATEITEALINRIPDVHAIYAEAIKREVLRELTKWVRGEGWNRVEERLPDYRHVLSEVLLWMECGVPLGEQSGIADLVRGALGVNRAEQIANEMTPRGCACGNNGGGDCEWCQNKSIAEEARMSDEKRLQDIEDSNEIRVCRKHLVEFSKPEACDICFLMTRLRVPTVKEIVELPPPPSEEANNG